MSLPSLPTASSLIRNLISSKGSGHSEASEAVEAVPEVFVNKPPPLFALIIGINEYTSDEFDDLGGSVADAEAVKTYLETSLGVPTSQIKTLINKEATRDAIIAALRGLKNNTSIQRGNPILIYYAGHGSTVDAPTGWEAGGPEIQILVTHDTLCDLDGNVIVGIPDRTIGVLLEQLAQEKDDNITVIFDCCHSGSLTRKNDDDQPHLPRVRGVEMPVKISPDLDRDIWGGIRGTSIAAGFLKSGLRSHVLLSACGANEGANEEDGRGYFTKRLLDTLEAAGADKLTYADLIQRIPSMPAQSPQCEGYNQHRICFDSKAPVQSSRMYRVRKVDQHYSMDAGTIHGITNGAKFALYNDRDQVWTHSPVATLTASKPQAFVTPLIPPAYSPPFDIGGEAFALLIRAGEQEDLRLHVPPDEKLLSVFQALANEMEIDDPTQPKIMLVEKETADLDITFVDDHIVLNILDPLVTIHGLNRMPFRIPKDAPGAMSVVLRKAAHYLWHLRRTGNDRGLQSHVGIELTRLDEFEEEYDEDLNPVRRPRGPNLINNGVMDIVVEEKAIYGIKLTNKWSEPLYPSLFYFDNSDLSITPYFQPATSSGKVDHPLPPHGSITIGYGSGGGSPVDYSLREGQDVDVGSLKLFISTEQVDLWRIPQQSPFDDVTRTVSTRIEKPMSEEKPVGMWNSSLITIIQRRYPSS